MKSQAERNYTTVTEGIFFKFENAGDAIEGTLDKAEEIQIDGKPVSKYFLTDDSGEKYTFLGGAKLDEYLDGIEFGSFIRITYLEMLPLKGGKRMKSFRVEVAD